MFWVNGDVEVIAFVGKEWENASCSTQSIIECELHKQKKVGLVVLLVVAENAEVLLECLVSLFCLIITFRIISRSEVKLHVEGFSRKVEEAEDEL